MRPTIFWLSQPELEKIYSSEYWNSIENEKIKPWWIENGNFEKCLQYLESSGLMQEYLQAETYIRDFEGDNLSVADLGAGIGWTTAMLSKNPKINKIHAVEISQHRIEKLFPQCMKMLDGEEGKVFRYIGSFYDLKLPEDSIDIIFMSQAFHHAEQPELLLKGCRRILKTSGRIIVVGEHYIGPLQFVKKFIAMLIREKRIALNFDRLFPPDPESGDHFYRTKDYRSMFSANGFEIKHLKPLAGKLVLIADKMAV